jgi:asparagine synthase (glutamine-hydrolysing)
LRYDSWQGIYENFVHSAKSYEIKELLGHVTTIKEKSFIEGEKDHPMQGMMLWDYHRYMIDDILTKVDRATMSLSIEGREPLLDHRIAEFMAQVPFELKYKNGDSKYLLKKVLERYIPKEMIYRKKMGFGIPIFEWFSSDLKEMFDNNFTERELAKHNLLNIEYINQEYKKISKKNIVNLWLILVFQLWYKKYMN